MRGKGVGTRGPVLASIIALGAALRLWQYLADKSMWFDEFSVARNITERSLSQLLTRPLAYGQTAPLGFLTAVDISSTVLGPSDLALRLFPLLCGIAALLLFWRVADHVLSGVAVPVAVASFALSVPLIRYSAELKQYSGDAAILLALTLVALDLCERPPSVRRCVAAGIAGCVAALFSQAAVMVMAGIGAALTLRWMLVRDAAARRPVLVTVPMWAAASLAGLLVAMRYTSAETMEFMHQFWGQRLGFLPLPTSAGGFAFWARERFVQFFGAMSGYPWPALYTLLAALGFIVLWKRRRDAALILLGPIAVTFLAAIAQQYPFRVRLVLFLLPAMLLAAGAAVGWISERLASTNSALGAAAAFAALVPPVAAIVMKPPPYAVEQFKPVLAYVQAHRRDGDRVYVFSNAYEGVARYGPRYGLTSGAYVVGVCDEREYRPFLEDFDRLRGAPRVWVIASSVPDFYPARRGISRYLQAIGVRRDSISFPSTPPMSPVSAELYDLSDTMRLRAAVAATFRVQADTLHPICFDWIRPTQVIARDDGSASPASRLRESPSRP